MSNRKVDNMGNEHNTAFRDFAILGLQIDKLRKNKAKRLAELNLEISLLKEQNATLAKRISDIENSRSWRATKTLRSFMRSIKDIFGK